MKKSALILTFILLVTTLFAGCGGGTSYEDLVIMPGVELGVEEYGIAFRKGSDMVAKVDAATKELYEDGTIKALAEKYGITDTYIKEFSASTDSNPTGESDYDYIKSKGTMVIGMTNYKPMNYKGENGEWIGFDTEYAEAVGRKLGVNVEFKEIIWDNKEFELESKSIDCIWNGMTITDAIKEFADVTGAYVKNYQVVVVKDGVKFTTLESLKGKKVVAEEGSAGETIAKADPNLSVGYVPVESMADALLMVKSGQADACVIDFVMANSMVGNKN